MQIITNSAGNVVGVTTDSDEVEDLAPGERVMSVPGPSVLLWQKRTSGGFVLVEEEEDGVYPPSRLCIIVPMGGGEVDVLVRDGLGWLTFTVDSDEMAPDDLPCFAEAMLCEAWL